MKKISHKAVRKYIRIRQQTLTWQAFYMQASVCGGHHPGKVICGQRDRKEPCLFENGRVAVRKW